MSMNAEQLKLIERTAARLTNYEQCENDPYGYNPGDSGNFDDAHEDGVDDGEIRFARRILALETSA
jgi:hypothetical protein